jgi:hypothetical protein
MIEVQILIPEQSNEGGTFEAGHHAAFEAVVLAALGGITRMPEGAVGSWLNDAGERFDDATRVYVIALKSIGQGGTLAGVVAFAKAHYRQQAIYIRYLGVSETL